jgi:D-serine deaminase-like pyridoxal phosphate-dependent protein
MSTIRDLNTPAALVDTRRMHDNIERMQRRMNALGVELRPHVKTSKCLPVVQAQLAAGAQHGVPGRRKRHADCAAISGRHAPSHPSQSRLRDRSAAPRVPGTAAER